MEYYATIKRIELWTHAMTWMTFKNIMLRKRSQTKRTKRLYMDDSIYKTVYKRQNIGTEPFS